jgi:hypothetical protein
MYKMVFNYDGVFFCKISKIKSYFIEFIYKINILNIIRYKILLYFKHFLL